MHPHLEFIKEHALKNYEKGGWDVIVECWSDEEIVEHLIKHNVIDEESAIRSFAALIDVWSDRQADAINSQF